MVKNNKIEDIAIARIFKKHSVRVACLLGDDRISCRMYHGFSDSINGFSKNVIAFFGDSFLLASMFWLFTTFGFLTVLFCLSKVLFAVYIIAFLLIRIFVSVASRQNLFYNLLFIIPLQVSLGIFIYKAFINKLFRKFQWKGRNID
jgi:hypothetical protein